jgi:hypothetical protein
MKTKLAIGTIIDAIMNLDNTYEVGQVIDAIKLKQNYLASEARRNFVAGDRVQFTSRNGSTYQGTVDKIKQKYILVSVDSKGGFPMRYNVPATMLSKVA